MESAKQNNDLMPQMARFCLVGVGNTLVDFAIYLGLTRFWSFWAEWYLIANLLSFLAANIFSFIVNKHWTFGSRGENYYQEYLKFLSVSLGALVIVEGTLLLFVEVFGGYDVWGKIIGTALSIVWSFLMHRSWTFKIINN